MSTKHVTVSVKIPVDVKEKLEKKGKRPGKIAKEAIMKAVEEIELEEIEKTIEDVKSSLEKLDVERITKELRKDRER